jgi:spermidine synthase
MPRGVDSSFRETIIENHTMKNQNSGDAISVSESRRFLPLLLLLFFGSGCSALIYEIVWFQLLQLVIGSSAISLGVLLGTFMGGMCLGSLALPRLISARQHPLRVYAFLELGIGIIGLLILFGMPYVDELYAGRGGYGTGGILLRAVVAAACLLPPTLLMGATLPAVGRWVESTPRDVAWLGFFYGGNIAGAVFGCLLAGFYLLRVHDMATAVYVAAGINAVVALLGFGLAKGAPHTAPSAGADGKRAAPVPGAWTVYLAIALSGMGALGAEVIWTRILSLMLGATVYTFSIILAVFLVGLGLGSGFGSLLARRNTHPRLALGLCQLFLAGAIAWTAYIVAGSLPFWPIVPNISHSVWFNFQLDLVRCLWAILPPTVLWGASFPLALAAVASRGQDSGRLVGRVYAANTAGAIIGALVASLFLIAAAGTQLSQQILIGLAATTALMVLATSLLRFRASSDGEVRPETWLAAGGLFVLVAGLTAALAWTVPSVPGELVAWGRQMPSRMGEAKVIYVGEGMNSSVAVSVVGKDTRNFHVAGKVEASTYPEDMRLQRLLGHVSALVHTKPRKVLVVGCGAGVTAGTFVLHPDVERVVICEIEPLIPQVVATHFKEENYDVLHDPRVEVVYDDARHFVLSTQEKFDVITSDPIHPWVKGAASLYTREYFELCKQHLNPGGVVTQWVPLYESDFATVRSELATFFDAFPEGTVWSNCLNGEGYDVVLLGQVEGTKIDVDQFEQRLAREDHERVAASLKMVKFDGAMDLLATYAGWGPDLHEWLKDADINRDRNLRLQYLAGMSVNQNQGGLIYQEMLSHRTFPDAVFTGTARRKALLEIRVKWPQLETEGVQDLFGPMP